MADLPPADSPLRKLPNFTDGFSEDIKWKPGFDDPNVPAAGGTQEVYLVADVKYARPSIYPSQIFLAVAPPNQFKLPDLAMQAAEIGTLISYLLRHGWTPAQLVDKTKRGSMSRAAALFLARCPVAVWDAPSPYLAERRSEPPANG